MPRFSVIVPAYDVQAHLHACLESVLSQSFDDLELIVVDDRSPDGSRAVVDEVAARDRRVVAVRTREHQGPGPARNAGLDRATGDYVVFLDGDDTLVPDALRTIADRLKETGSPDVLVYGHARVHWSSGDAVRSEARHPFTQAGPAPFALADRPELLRAPHVAWNKAYQREFLERAGLRFPGGLYEDVPWTYPVLMAAGSLATLDRVCVHHRLRRTGSLLRTTSRRHFDVFEQYERLFAFLDGRPDLERWRPVLFRRMVDHVTSVATAPGRLPRGSRAAFFRLARAHYRRHRTPGAAPAFRTRIRHGLVRCGAHRVLRSFTAARALKARAARRTGALLRGLRGGLLRLHYRVQLRLPLRADQALFTAGSGPAAVEERVRELVPRLRTAWICPPGHAAAVPSGARRLRPGTAAYWTALARSAYLVADTDPDGRAVKRRGQVVVRTPHGTPLKHQGLDLRHRPATHGSLDVAALLRSADTWDYLVSPNRHSTLVLERVLPAAYRTLEYGSPRNDVFQRAGAADVAALRTALGVPEGHTAVLYAPTHRDYVTPQPLLLDLERVAVALGPRFVILARRHPTQGPGDPAFPEHPRVIDVTAHPSVEELCLASDALVTDYSSIMFDYASLDRPIVVHTEDWDAYAAARGTYFDLRSFPPGAVARSEDELIDIFATGHWRGSRSAQLRAAFRARFCPYDDGRAAERVVRHVFLGQDPATLPPVVPQEDRRPAPAPAPAP
ncbi:CDP-glycerol:glycerophosphate glycerophosphotransferase [Streptomyces sp. TRM64462]|uniref:bifunctional glycosyltransferase/CDP-glycerol:glycerophosphate glycerophosphotransferase n=1 Tax=Streptomyces sp. TRM64462 TaxID=2741726 RepID=UPI0015867D25|nr:CDP-glycerol:glycerophosphate glycerophosphotransferase [Streptomyces sp. TRM64462]